MVAWSIAVVACGACLLPVVRAEASPVVNATTFYHRTVCRPLLNGGMVLDPAVGLLRSIGDFDGGGNPGTAAPSGGGKGQGGKGDGGGQGHHGAGGKGPGGGPNQGSDSGGGKAQGGSKNRGDSRGQASGQRADSGQGSAGGQGSGNTSTNSSGGVAGAGGGDGGSTAAAGSGAGAGSTAGSSSIASNRAPAVGSGGSTGAVGTSAAPTSSTAPSTTTDSSVAPGDANVSAHPSSGQKNVGSEEAGRSLHRNGLSSDEGNLGRSLVAVAPAADFGRTDAAIEAGVHARPSFAGTAHLGRQLSRDQELDAISSGWSR